MDDLQTRTHGVEEPEHLLCPITQVLFQDPVCIESGNVYERAAILGAWKGSSRGIYDPRFNLCLQSPTMITSWDTRRQVETFLAAHPDYIPHGWTSRDVPTPPLNAARPRQHTPTSPPFCLLCLALCGFACLCALGILGVKSFWKPSFLEVSDHQASACEARLENARNVTILSSHSAYWQAHALQLSAVLIFVPGLLLAEGANWAPVFAGAARIIGIVGRNALNVMEFGFALCTWSLTTAFTYAAWSSSLISSASISLLIVLCVRAACVGPKGQAHVFRMGDGVMCVVVTRIVLWMLL